MKKYFSFLVILISTLFLSSCASWFGTDEPSKAAQDIQRQKNIQTAAPVKVVEAKPITVDQSAPKVSPHVKAAHTEVEKQLAPSQPIPPRAETKVDAEPLLTPPQSLAWLKNGNARFLKHRLRADGQSLKDIKRLAHEGQHPHTIVLACSEAIVPPEIIFDQKLGELFVVRTMGESLDKTSLGSIEYALTRYQPNHILILGHTHCGGILGACTFMNGAKTMSENASAIYSDIGARLQIFKGKDPSENLEPEAWVNVIGLSEDLPKRSEIVGLMVKNREVQISTAVYDVDSGKVEFR